MVVEGCFFLCALNMSHRIYWILSFYGLVVGKEWGVNYFRSSLMKVVVS